MSNLKGLQKLRTFNQGMDLNKFMQTEFRQNMRAIERSLNQNQTQEQIANGVFLIKTGAQTLTATDALIKFESVSLDPDSLYLDGVVTIKKTGRYDIVSCISATANLATSQNVRTSLYINDSAAIQGRLSYGNGANIRHRSEISVLNYPLKENDRLSLFGASSAAATLNVDFNQCFFSLKFVGL